VGKVETQKRVEKIESASELLLVFLFLVTLQYLETQSARRVCLIVQISSSLASLFVCFLSRSLVLLAASVIGSPDYLNSSQLSQLANNSPLQRTKHNTAPVSDQW